MSSDPCPRCDQRIVRKPVTSYWAYYPEPAVRRSYMSKLCAPCAVDLLLPLVQRDPEDRGLCPACGTEPGPAPDQTFLTLYVPNKERWDDAFPTCPDCTDAFRRRVTAGGKLQPDRGAEVRGPSPAEAALAALPW